MELAGLYNRTKNTFKYMNFTYDKKIGQLINKVKFLKGLFLFKNPFEFLYSTAKKWKSSTEDISELIIP